MERSDLLVAAQGAALAVVLAPGRPRWRLPRPVGALAAGAVLAGGTLALAGMLPHGTRITPRARPPAGAGLVTGGAYRFTRNPIYTGLALAVGGVAVLRRRPAPLLAAAVLPAVLAAKVRAEEAALLERFGDAYAGYAARTPRFLPGVRRRCPVSDCPAPSRTRCRARCAGCGPSTSRAWAGAG